VSAKREAKPAAKGPKARPRATPPVTKAQAEAEREAKRVERAARRAERKAEAEREAKRVARAARRAERKAEAEREAKRTQAALAKKRRRAAEKVRKIREAAQLVEEELKRERRNKKRRDERRMRRQGKLIEDLAATKAPRPEHPPASQQDLVTAEMVLIQMREDQREAAEHAEARYRTHLYPETGDIDGLVWRDAVDGEIGTTLGLLGDAFRPMIDGLFYREMYFQGIATFTIAKSAEANMKKDDSPLNESKIGPDGKHYRSATTYWFHGDAQKAIAAVEYMVANIQAKHPEFELVKIGIRTYWSPVERRPER
jgi:hypothetical protein